MPESANRRLHFLYLSTSGYIYFYLYYKYLQNSKTLSNEFFTEGLVALKKTTLCFSKNIY